MVLENQRTDGDRGEGIDANERDALQKIARISGLFRRFLHYRRCFREGETAQVIHAIWEEASWSAWRFALEKRSGVLWARCEGSESLGFVDPQKEGWDALFCLEDDGVRLLWRAEDGLPWRVGERLIGGKGDEAWQAWAQERLQAQTVLSWEDAFWGGGRACELEPFADQWGWPVVWGFRSQPVDLNARRKHFEQLALQMKAMSYLVRGLVHDINNFLTGVMANLSMARLSMSEASEAASFLEAAEDSSARMGESMQDLTFLSLAPSEWHGEAALDAILRALSEERMFGQHGVSLRWSRDAVKGQIALEPQLAKDLLFWTLRFLSRFCGSEQAHVQAHSCWRIDPTAPKQGQIFLCVVLETALRRPISSVENGEIFWPYIELDGRRQFSSLSRVWTALRGMGGWIEVEQKQTTAVFRLVMPGLLEPRVGERGAPKDHSVRVLLVDDEELVLESVTATLKALGYDVTGVSSGEEAIHLFQEAEEKGKSYHLALLDLSLQGAIDGLETARRIRLLDEEVRLVLLSGYDPEFVLQSHPEHRFDAAVQKPFRIAALARLLADVLTRAR